jgi:NADH:ubiquinone oxidoreductase subunit 6 (subunit J)
MGRLILIFIAIGAICVMIMSMVRTLQSASNNSKEASVPRTAKTISYVLLIVLMFGVVTGWLGGL